MCDFSSFGVWSFSWTLWLLTVRVTSLSVAQMTLADHPLTGSSPTHTPTNVLLPKLGFLASGEEEI